jgi:hypothetical protein
MIYQFPGVQCALYHEEFKVSQRIIRAYQSEIAEKQNIIDSLKFYKQASDKSFISGIVDFAIEALKHVGDDSDRK